MKIQREPDLFRAVKITIETREELATFIRAFVTLKNDTNFTSLEDRAKAERIFKTLSEL